MDLTLKAESGSSIGFQDYDDDDATAATDMTGDRNQARAQEMQALYEMSSNKDVTLNKNAQFIARSLDSVPSYDEHEQRDANLQRDREMIRNETIFSEGDNSPQQIALLYQQRLEAESNRDMTLNRQGVFPSNLSALSVSCTDMQPPVDQTKEPKFLC
jgi:transcription termination factor NusB